MDRRIQKTRKAIQDAYFSLLTEKPGSRITVAEIARRANIDRKTFYLHYVSAEDIILQFSRDKVKNFLDILKSKNFFDRPVDVTELFRILNQFIEQDFDFYSHISINENYSFFWSHLCDILIAAMHDLYFSVLNVTAERFNIYARYTAYGIISLYRSWLKKEIPVSLDELGTMAGEAAYWGLHKLFANSLIPETDAAQ